MITRCKDFKVHMISTQLKAMVKQDTDPGRPSGSEHSHAGGKRC